MLGDAVREDDVEREERGVGEGERDPDGLGRELDVGEQVDAADRQDEREAVPRRPRADRRERDHRQELDRRHGAERQPVDGDVEADVHHGEHRPHGDDEPPPGDVEGGERPPRAAPGGEDQRRARDAQPRDPERLDEREEEHGEGRPEVVEDRATRRSRSAGGSPLDAADRDGRVHGESVAAALRFRNGRPKAFRGASAYEAQLLDETNRRIVEQLQADARLSMAELGRRVNLSAPAVADRVQRLEQAGVITGYHADDRPEGDRLPARGGRPRPPRLAPAAQDPRGRRARSPRWSSATGSRARTASS